MPNLAAPNPGGTVARRAPLAKGSARPLDPADLGDRLDRVEVGGGAAAEELPGVLEARLERQLEHAVDRRRAVREALRHPLGEAVPHPEFEGEERGHVGR